MYQLAQGRHAYQRVALFLFAVSFAIHAQSPDLVDKSRQAKELMAAGRFSDAVPIYEELVRALPANPGLHLNLGLALHLAGRHRESIPQFEIVLKSDPASIPALNSLGSARLALNDPANAVPPLQKLAAIQPSNVDVRGMLANALLALDRAREASTHFRKLTTLAPADPKAWYGLGRSYETLAGQAFEQLTKSSEGSAEWLALIAETRVVRRQYRSAYYFYRQALEKSPGLRGAHAAIAQIYRTTGHEDWAAVEVAKEKAIPALDCAREKPACDYAAGRFLDAASSGSPYWRARSYNELALRSFSQLGKLPESVELHAVKAELAASHDQFREAADEWLAALKLAPGDPRLQQELATAVYMSHDYKAALPLLQGQLRIDPHSAELNFFTGDSLLRLEDPGNAISYLQAALAANPKLAPAHASLGLALSRTGKNLEAVPHLEKAVDIDEDGSLHYQLARAYQSVGAREKAQAAMARYQEILKRSEEGKQSLDQEAQIGPPER